MLREVNPVTTRRSRAIVREQGYELRTTCILCRVLWPIVVQHRHLVSDWPEETETVITQKPTR
jgi:hypothetical protein